MTDQDRCRSDERQTERDGWLFGGRGRERERAREYVEEDTLFVYNDYLRKAKAEKEQTHKQHNIGKKIEARRKRKTRNVICIISVSIPSSVGNAPKRKII